MDWNRFRSKYKGKGYTVKQLSKMYKDSKKVKAIKTTKANMKGGKESESCKKCYRCVGPDQKQYTIDKLEKENKEELDKRIEKLKKNIDNCTECNNCGEPIISKEALINQLYNNSLMIYKTYSILYDKGMITEKSFNMVRELMRESNSIKKQIADSR